MSLCPANNLGGEQCVDKGDGQNYCSEWCNNEGIWGCGIATAPSWPPHDGYTCNCGGCGPPPPAPSAPYTHTFGCCKVLLTDCGHIEIGVGANYGNIPAVQGDGWQAGFEACGIGCLAGCVGNCECGYACMKTCVNDRNGYADGCPANNLPGEQCVDKGEVLPGAAPGVAGENYCSEWCNTKGKWGCGIATDGDYTCNCGGCGPRSTQLNDNMYGNNGPNGFWVNGMY